MERLKIGEWKEKGLMRTIENISWRDWEKREGKFLILALFSPHKYPSWTLSFLDEEKNVRVRKTMDEKVALDVAKVLKSAKGKVYLRLKSNVNRNAWEIFLEIEEDSEYSYNKEGKALILRKRKDDIPF